MATARAVVAGDSDLARSPPSTELWRGLFDVDDEDDDIDPDVFSLDFCAGEGEADFVVAWFLWLLEADDEDDEDDDV
jgi:hypothetical protein